jgi:hypothetical protein
MTFLIFSFVKIMTVFFFWLVFFIFLVAFFFYFYSYFITQYFPDLEVKLWFYIKTYAICTYQNLGNKIIYVDAK